MKWFLPLTKEKLLQLKVTYPEAKLVIGNTEIGVEVKFKNQHYPVLINTRHIPELNEIKRMESGVYVGSAVTLTRLSRFLKGLIQQEPTNKTRSFEAIIEMLKWFAGIQIRNVASIGGNIVTASPISDLNPLLMAAGASLDVLSIKGARKISLDDSFFLGYRKIALESNEVLGGVHIPFTRNDEYFYGFKQAQRKEDDISIVNAGMMVEFEEDSNKVKEIRLSFGGMAATTVMAKKTMTELKGRIWNTKMMNLAIETLLEDLPLTPGAPGGMEAYRQSLALGFFFKFFIKVSTDISSDEDSLPEHWKSAVSELTSKPFKSTQLFQEVSESQDIFDPVGRPQMVLSALQQATGEAVYNDDLPRIEGELFLALVYSTNAHANIRSIDFEAALSVEGVYDVVSAKDVPGENSFHVIVSDETLFADEKVY
ncbi:Xanthine dehydrogenase/oxidase [Holothuria leucospilota]|uniref:Xanthine dehydrogenase/oxidase n=1 Tax=Holothuria leucospilota TaxID=206669 RepID=A0A9Q0YID5_HOLLE|nr:Xanthine dehydrogenase/oxidase [Holothuria leucospilota]